MAHEDVVRDETKNVEMTNILHICSPFGTMSIKTFADSIGVAKSTVYSWRTNGDIPAECFKEVGGTIFVIEKKMRAFFES